MRAAGNSLSTQHLVQFLAFVSAAADEGTAALNAVECAAQLLEAELAAVVVDGQLVHSVGFRRGQVPVEEVLKAAEARRGSIFVPGLGECVTVVGREAGDPAVQLVVGRLPDEGFTPEEVNLIRGMGRALGLTIGMGRALQAERDLHEQSRRQAAENADLLQSVQDGQRLLEQLSLVQRAISRHEPLAVVFDMIVAGARDLVRGDVVVSVHLATDGRQALSQVTASSSSPAATAADKWRAGLLAKAAERSMLTGQLVRAGPVAGPTSATGATGATEVPITVLATPVHEGLNVAGALSMAIWGPGRHGNEEDEAVLVAFADHASLALSDAHILEQMRLALLDSLTGLASRPVFLTKLRERLAAVGRRGGAAVLFIDLDGFKVVNDTLGHSCGDRLLVEVGRRIANCLRASDVAARVGGDEFAVLLPGDDCLARARSVAQRLLDSLAGAYVIDGHQISAGASIGIAISEGPGEAEDLVRDADIAMYHAKQSGRGRSQVFEAVMRERFSHGHQLVGRGAGGA